MWGALLLILFATSFFYLFVCVDPHSGSFLSHMRLFFFKAIPGSLRRNGRAYLGDRFVDFIESVIHYICFSTNPIV